MSLQKIIDRLKSFGIEASFDSRTKTLVVEHKGNVTSIEVSEEWLKEIRHITKAKKYTFDSETRTLQSNNWVEFGLRTLDRMSFRRPDYVFKSDGSDEMRIGVASKRWMLGFMLYSKEYERFVEVSLLPRIERNDRKKDKEDFQFLTWRATVALFKTMKRLSRNDLLHYASSKTESCFLKLAIDFDECFDFSKYSEKEKVRSYEGDLENKFQMPIAIYSPPLAKFYKVAKSSQFPSQAFLSYYHILEYQFYRISDFKLYTKVRSQISDTQFSSSDDSIRKLLAVVFKHKQNLNETDLLKMVLEHYIEEEEFVEFLVALKGETGRDYEKKHDVFGEEQFINTQPGHVFPNGAKVIKHIRNYLVHSSDKNTRDDRHVPLTEDDNLVLDYIPIVRFLAEKVIYGAAENS